MSFCGNDDYILSFPMLDNNFFARSLAANNYVSSEI